MRNRNLWVQVVLALRFRKISLSLLCLLMFISLTPRGFTADVYWINPAGGNWDTPGNWSTGAVPGPTDDVFITLDGTYTVTLTGSKSVNSLTLGDATNTGVQALWIRGSDTGGNTTVTAANGFTNAGTLRLESIYSTYQSNLTVSSGTLTNTGVINVGVGTGGGRTISANLLNKGIINVNYSLTLSKVNGVYTNETDINIAAGMGLFITGQGQTFNQNIGTIAGSGILQISGATLNFTGGSLTGGAPFLINSALNLGSLSTKSGSLTMTGPSGTLSGDIPVEVTVWIQGSDTGGNTTVTAANGFTNAGTLRLESIYSTYQSNLTATSGTLTNTGTITVNQGTGGSRTISANLLNQGTININWSLTLSKSGGVYTNETDINIAAGRGLFIAGQGQTFSQNSGTIAGSGILQIYGVTLNFNGGALAGGAPFLINSALNLGSSSTGTGSLTMTGPSSTLSGNIPAGVTVWIQGSDTGGNTIVTAANGFTNAGTLRLESIYSTYQSNLTVSSGTLTNTGTITVNPGTGGGRTLSANLVNDGTVTINTNVTFSKTSGVYTNNNTVNITAGTVTISGSNQVFNQNGGTLNIAGAFNLSSATFNFNGGTMTGTPLLTNMALNIGTGGTTPASFTMGGISTLSGDLSAGQTLWIQGSDTGGNTTVTAANGFTNAGTLRLESIYSTYQSNLTVSSGTLTNTGVINVNVGTGGGRAISGALANQGAINVNSSLTLSGVYTNTGSITIAQGRTLSVSSGSQFSNQSEGTLTVNGAFNLSGTTFTFNSGTATGNPPLLINSALNLGSSSTGTGNLTMTGPSGTLSGNIPAGVTVWIQGSDTGGNTTVTAANGFTNAGTLRLESIYSTYQSNLTVSSGTLTNTGVINVGVGTGGGRTISANLLNKGIINVNYSLTLSKVNGVYTNETDINIAAGMGLFITGQGQTFNQNIGTIAGSGILQISGATLNFTGGSLTGGAPFLINSALNLGSSSTGTGNLTMTGPSGTLSGNIPVEVTVWIQGSDTGGNTTVTAANGFTNAGTLRLESIYSTYQSNLTVTSGTLTNMGTITVNPGTGDGRTISANLLNKGIINVNYSLTLSTVNGVYTNEKDINIAAGMGLFITGQGQTFNQNSGTIAGSDILQINGATLNFNGGTLTSGAPFLINSALNLGSSSTGTGSLTMTGPSSTLSGNIPAGVTVWIQGSDTGGNTIVTAANGFTNAGTLRLESIYSTYQSNLTVSSGTLTNTGTINVNAGSGGGRTITAELNNQGTVNIGTATSLGRAGADHANSGTINLTGGDLTLNQSGTTPTFTNTGTINVAGRTFTVSGGTFSNTAPGTIIGGGTVNLNSATFFGVGAIVANVNNNGSQVNPGASPGTLNITGNYTQNSSGVLNIEIGGPNPGTGFDQLNISGLATLSGTINIIQISPTFPVGNLVIMTFGSRSGDFTTKSGLNGRQLSLSNTNLVIVVTGATISAVQVTNISPHGATISWLTDIGATSQVEYGTTTAYGQLSPLQTTLVTTHQVTLSGLNFGTLYHCRARSTDVLGNESISGDFTFTTTVPGPELAIAVSNLTSWVNDSRTFSATLTNTGGVPLDFTTLQVTGVTWISPLSSLTTLAPGATQQFWFALNVPSNAIGGAFPNPVVYPLKFEAQISDGTTFEQDFTLQLLDVPVALVDIQVVDQTNGAPLANALVMIEGDDTVYGTASNGHLIDPSGQPANILTTPGTKQVSAFKSGYLPQTESLTLSALENHISIALEPGQVFSVGAVETKTLTEQEIIDAGVDLADPVNNWVYEFKVTIRVDTPSPPPPLQFPPVVLPKINPGPGPSPPSPGDYPLPPQTTRIENQEVRVVPTVYIRETHTVYSFLFIPGEIKLLKEFFEVKAVMKNDAAGPDFAITDIAATLSFPAALALPALDGLPQSPTIAIGTIPAGGEASATWVVRGDAEGTHTVNVSATGTLQPFGAPLVASNSGSVTVFGKPTLDVTFFAPAAVVKNQAFTFTMNIKNTSPIPVYNVTTTLFIDDFINVRLASGEQATKTVGTIQPGETKPASYQLVAEITGSVNLPNSAVTTDPAITPHLSLVPIASQLALTLTGVEPSPRAPGDLWTLNVDFANNSPLPLTNAPIRVPIPQHTTYEPNSATSGGILSGGEVVWSFAQIAAATAIGQRSFQVRIADDVAHGTEIQAQARLSADELFTAVESDAATIIVSVTLSIVSPTANQTFLAGTTSTMLEVNIANHPSPGHWHWQLDTPFPTSGPAGGNMVTSGNTATITGLMDGRTYTVYATLVDGDHNVLSPPVTASVTFRVDSPPVDPLLIQYEPTLYFYGDANPQKIEFYTPVNVDAYVKRCSLWYDDPLLVPQEIAQEGNLLTLDFFNGGVTIGETNYFLKFLQETDKHGTLDSEKIRAKYQMMKDNGEVYNTYYGHKVEDGDYIILQYWFFYVMNDWKSGYNGWNDHEGDWEGIMVFLDRASKSPLFAAYSMHHREGHNVVRMWNQISKEGDHPIVYVAAGSHANYFDTGDPDTPGRHQTYAPGELGEISTGKYDYTNNSGEVIHGGLAANGWKVRKELSDETLEAWVNNYAGKWGMNMDVVSEWDTLYGFIPLPRFGFDGPQGPKFTGRWKGTEALDWVDADQLVWNNFHTSNSEKGPFDPTQDGYQFRNDDELTDTIDLDARIEDYFDELIRNSGGIVRTTWHSFRYTCL